MVETSPYCWRQTGHSGSSSSRVVDAAAILVENWLSRPFQRKVLQIYFNSIFMILEVYGARIEREGDTDGNKNHNIHKRRILIQK